MNSIQVRNGLVTCVNVPEPTIAGDDSVKIKVRVAGLCGSDVHRFRSARQNPSTSPHCIPGHEIVGEVIDASDNVVDLVRGQRVVVSPLLWKHSLQLLNPHTAYGSIGKTHNGGFADYVIVPRQNVLPLAPSTSDVAGVFVDSLAVVMKCYSWLKPEGRHAVIGGGSLATLTARLLDSEGIDTTLLMNLSGEMELRRSPFHNSLNIDDAVERLHDSYAGVVEAVGGAQYRTISAAIKLCAPNGKVAVLGVFPELPVMQIPMGAAFRKELLVRGINSYDRGPNEDHFIAALDNISKLRTDDLVADSVSFEDFPEVINNLLSGGVRPFGKYLLIP